jgi:glyoxylase-like metal-dependent hydrolase (beta-lactamase superfamily II)
MARMRELEPGLWHWSARHERIGSDVSSYYLLGERVLIDPMLPGEGLEWFERHGSPEHVVLSNRHHDRHAWRLRDAFGCTVHCIRNGLHELQGRGPVEPFDFGDELPGGIRVHEVDAISPDETALHVPRHRALACADGIVRRRGAEQLAFVPDQLMDDPEQTKAGLRKAYRSLLGLDFDLLLLAHGEPLASGAREAIRGFVGDCG